jgi:hypothetical protein
VRQQFPHRQFGSEGGLSSPASTTSRRLWFVPGVDRDASHMGDVLDLCRSARSGLVCFGESLIHPIDQIRQPVPPEPARSTLTEVQTRWIGRSSADPTDHRKMMVAAMGTLGRLVRLLSPLVDPRNSVQTDDNSSPALQGSWGLA